MVDSNGSYDSTGSPSWSQRVAFSERDGVAFRPHEVLILRSAVDIADRVLVMLHVATFFEGTPQEMLADERVIEVYLGSRHRKGGAS